MAQAYIPQGGAVCTDSSLYYARLRAMQKDEVIGVLLAFFLGGFGAHHFYLRRFGLGTVYLLFFWTGIPALVALVECFLMPGRVRRYNLEQHLLLSAELGEPLTMHDLAIPAPAWVLPAPFAPFCSACGIRQAAAGRYCGHCGAVLSAA